MNLKKFLDHSENIATMERPTAGHQINLGRFDDVEEAAKAYRDAKKRLHKFSPEVRQ